MKNRLQIIRNSLQKNSFSKVFQSMKFLVIKFLFVSLLFSNLLITFPNSTPVFAQKVVTVTADQPNIWTLEQAHYLLAQMHRRNLDLKAKGLAPLDANEINGINIDILKSILEIGATYDDAARFNNNITKQDKTFNNERRRKLINDIDGLEKEKLELTRVIATLKYESDTADSEDEKKRIDAQILKQTEIKAEVDSQIESKRSELSSLSAAGGNVSNTTGGATFDPNKFPPGFMDAEIKAQIKNALEGLGANPKLNASLQLDKFVQLQYEIISKQLTLLRDEVGPGERLLFLELPQSINANYDKSDDMWAQSRWRISGFTGCMIKINNTPIACHKILNPDGIVRSQNRQSRTILDTYNAIINGENTLYDKFKLYLTDLKDRKELARRFVERQSDPKNTLLKNLVDIYQAKLPQNKEESDSESAYNTYWKEYRELEKKLKDVQKKFDEACNNSNQKCNDKAKLAEINNIQEEFNKAEAKISNPSGILLNYILKLLNIAIGDSDQLNKNNALNTDYQPYRTALLSKIDAKKEDTGAIKLLNRLWIEDLFSDEVYKLQEQDFPSEYIDLTTTKEFGTKKIIEVNSKKTKDKLDVENRLVRTVEIIPRQSSFNVNDIKVRNKSSALNFVVSTLFGLGGSFNYQQQRERYSQFVQQELYSSGFGKGSREFGWTFTSMPGTDRLLSGTRNTYAVVIVPQEATSIAVESIGCAFDRTYRQPENFESAIGMKTGENNRSKNNCGEERSFVIPIPGGGFDSNNDFYVSGLTYQPVENGKKVVVSIYGSNFSSQIGVMINGVALPAAIGLAQNFIVDDSSVAQLVNPILAQEKVKGNFERVDSNQIIASFSMDDFRDGTPVITLISPGKAVDLNTLDLYINGIRNVQLTAEDNKMVKWMFGKKPESDLKVNDVQVFVSEVNKEKPNEVTQLTVLISGKALLPIDDAYVNGNKLEVAENCKSNNKLLNNINCFGKVGTTKNNVLQLIFNPPEDEKIHIVLISGTDVFKLNPIANPAKGKKPKDPPGLSDDLKFTIERMTPDYTDDKKKIAYLLVEIKGKGFNPALEISVGRLDVVSETKAFITIPDPKPAQTITLTDTKKNIYATGVVEMSGILKPTPTPTPKPSS